MTKFQIAEKLKNGRIINGLTQRQVAERIGRSVKLVGHWETGYSQPDVDTLASLLDLYGIRANDFFEFDDPEAALKDSRSISPDEYLLLSKYRKLDERGRDTVSAILEKEYSHCLSAPPAQPTSTNNIKSFAGYFPDFGLASAGRGSYAQDEPLEWSFADEPPKGATCTITIKGDSMEPKLHDGETVWVDTTRMIESGQVGVFIINGEAFCKKFVSDENGVRFVSLNPAYEPIVPHEDDDVRLFGRVILK